MGEVFKVVSSLQQFIRNSHKNDGSEWSLEEHVWVLENQANKRNEVEKWKKRWMIERHGGERRLEKVLRMIWNRVLGEGQRVGEDRSEMRWVVIEVFGCWIVWKFWNGFWKCL